MRSRSWIEAVERREQRRAVGDRPDRLASGWASQSTLARVARRARGSAARRERARPVPGVSGVAGSGRPALGEVPEPLLPATPGDGDLAAEMQGHEHQADAPRSVPAMVARLAGRAVLELAREQRASALELAQDVAPERPVLRDEVAHASARASTASTCASGASGPRTIGSDSIGQMKAFHSNSARSSHSSRSSSVRSNGAEPAPEHELLRRRDGCDRIELEEPEPSARSRARRVRSRRVACARIGDPARLLRDPTSTSARARGIRAFKHPEQVPSRASWPTSSARTSSRPGCTSSTVARCGGSSTSST